jgi:hypothetical protein
MILITFPERMVGLMPNHYMGRWRIVLDATFQKNGKEMHECRMGFGNVFIE